MPGPSGLWGGFALGSVLNLVCERGKSLVKGIRRYQKWVPFLSKMVDRTGKGLDLRMKPPHEALW